MTVAARVSAGITSRTARAAIKRPLLFRSEGFIDNLSVYLQHRPVCKKRPGKRSRAYRDCCPIPFLQYGKITKDTKTEDKCGFKQKAAEATEVRDLQALARNDLRSSSASSSRPT